MTEHGVSLCSFPAGAAILDVGCGSGATVFRLREAYHMRAIGLDLQTYPSWPRPCDGGAPFVRGSAECLPFRSGFFEGVVCECVMSLLPDPDKALDEFSRVLCAGGFLVLTDLYLRRHTVPSVENRSHAPILPGIRTLDEVECMVVASGFQVLVREDHTTRLQEYAAQMILSGNSLDCCLPGWCGASCSDGAGTERSAGVRPGYYLMTARKN